MKDKKNIIILVVIVIVVFGIGITFFISSKKNETESSEVSTEIMEEEGTESVEEISEEENMNLTEKSVEEVEEIPVEELIVEEPEYTFKEIGKALWTIEGAIAYKDVEGEEKLGDFPANNQVYISRKCVETGYCETQDADNGVYYISEDFLTKEAPEVEIIPEEIEEPEVPVEEPLKEVPTIPETPVEESVAEVPKTSSSINILKMEPEGTYVPSTFTENGYTFMDMGYCFVSWEGDKIKYSDVSLSNSIGIDKYNPNNGPATALRQCLETGAIEIWYAEEWGGNYWISGDGVRVGY